jgi:hypothetical protein
MLGTRLKRKAYDLRRLPRPCRRKSARDLLADELGVLQLASRVSSSQLAGLYPMAKIRGIRHCVSNVKTQEHHK